MDRSIFPPAHRTPEVWTYPPPSVLSDPHLRSAVALHLVGIATIVGKARQTVDGHPSAQEKTGTTIWNPPIDANPRITNIPVDGALLNNNPVQEEEEAIVPPTGRTTTATDKSRDRNGVVVIEAAPTLATFTYVETENKIVEDAVEVKHRHTTTTTAADGEFETKPDHPCSAGPKGSRGSTPATVVVVEDMPPAEVQKRRLQTFLALSFSSRNNSTSWPGSSVPLPLLALESGSMPIRFRLRWSDMSKRHPLPMCS